MLLLLSLALVNIDSNAIAIPLLSYGYDTQHIVSVGY